MNRSMKKNLFFGLMALAGLFTSCSQDDTDASPDCGQQPSKHEHRNACRFCKNTGLRTPATFPAGHPLRCILEVWTQGESPALKHREEQVGLTGDNVVFDFTIDEGTYDCLFWADFIGKDAKGLSTTIGDLSYGHYDDKFYATNNSTNGTERPSRLLKTSTPLTPMPGMLSSVTMY